MLAEASAACRAWGGIDPYWTLSEGTLIATVRPAYAGAALEALEDEDIAAAEVGEVMSGNGTVWLTLEDARVEKLREPAPDPYWPAYERAVREKWA